MPYKLMLENHTLNCQDGLSPAARLEELIDQLGGVPDESFFEDHQYFEKDFHSWLRSNPKLLKIRREEESQKKLATSNFTLLTKAGSGCWGDVYKSIDNALGTIVAVKVLNPTEVAREQMRQRKLNPFEVMKNEAGLAEYANVVPREFRVDEDGTPFIVMPFYKKFLGQVLHDDKSLEYRTSIANGMDFEKAKNYILDIAKGLSEMHRIRNRIHGDLKPDNIAIKEFNNYSERALISDLGTSTCGNFGWTLSPRDNMGFIYTRSPENFITGVENQKDSHPKTQSDNFALASIIYRMFTGEYILEKELNVSKDPESFFKTLGEERINKLIKKKLNKAKIIPKKLKKVIGDNLKFSPYERDFDGAVMHKKLEEAMKEIELWKYFKPIRRGLLYVGLSIAALAYLGYKSSIYEPWQLNMPREIPYGYNQTELNDSLEFISENISDLPKVFYDRNEKDNTNVKHSSKNRFVAYFVKCHEKTYNDLKDMENEKDKTRNFRGFTPNQFSDYRSWCHATGNDHGTSMEFPPQPYSEWGKSIEASIKRAENADGKIDLEDVCTISRLGIDIVNKAKKSSGNFDYKIYRDAKDSSGEYIISRPERQFIDLWLSYIHAGDFNSGGEN